MAYNHTVLTYSYSINNHTAHETPRLNEDDSCSVLTSTGVSTRVCNQAPKFSWKLWKDGFGSSPVHAGIRREERRQFSHTHTHKINKSQHVSHYIIRIVVKNTQYLTSRGSFKNTLKIHDFGDQSRLTIQNKTNNSF